jgi:hypothetical protein
MTWNEVDGASGYRVQFAYDPAFTIAVRNFETKSRAFILNNVNPGELIYGRVQAVNSYGAGGPWSINVSATAMDFPNTLPTDGFPPPSSPQPVVSGGVGMLVAEWLPVSNPDLVSYEVYISTVSGFQPSAATKVGETTGTFYVLTSLANGTDLDFSIRYYIRLIAKDADGKAPVGAQGSGFSTQIDLGDVGNVPNKSISDGALPSASPVTPASRRVSAYLYVKWEHPSNPDHLEYDIHISTASGFAPNTNTLIGTTSSNFTFIRRQGPGMANAALVYGQTYYIKIWAKDNDGYALSASLQAIGTTMKADTPDIAVGAITALSGIIADLAVDTAKIATWRSRMPRSVTFRSTKRRSPTCRSAMRRSPTWRSAVQRFKTLLLPMRRSQTWRWTN